MAETNRRLVTVIAVVALVLVVSLLLGSGMMGGWGWTNMGGSMMGGWNSNGNAGRSALTIGVWVLIAVGIGGILIWAIRRPRLH